MKADDDSLRRAMGLALRGDKAAYRLVLDQSRYWLLGFFRRRVAPAMIDDLVQETLMSVHSRRQSYDPSRPYLPWLAAIARYRWVDALRKIRTGDHVQPEDIASEEDDGSIVARLSIGRLLSYLPARQANAIVLTRIEGHSVAEAAQICGQSESLVKVNVHRGLRKLAALVESE
jgi:RNA polymerase sigma factor (sigma-70 family)